MQFVVVSWILTVAVRARFVDSTSNSLCSFPGFYQYQFVFVSRILPVAVRARFLDSTSSSSCSFPGLCGAVCSVPGLCGAVFGSWTPKVQCVRFLDSVEQCVRFLDSVE